MRKILSFVFILVVSESLWATEGLFTSIHHQYQSPRALGMGDAFVAVANDYASLFYNPAGLAKLDEGQINMAMDIGASASFYSFYQDVEAASKTTGTEVQKATAVINLLQKNYGKQFSIRSGLFEGIWVRPGWGLGVLPLNFSMDLSVHNQAAPALRARTYLDSTVAFGMGYPLRLESVPGQLAWGFTGKFVNRGFFSKDLNALDLVADSQIVKKEDLQEGYTVDADLGVLFTPNLSGWLSVLKLTKPTFGAVVRNVAEMGFGQKLDLFKSGSKEAPEKLYRVLDVGSRWEYPSFFIFGGRGALDIRDIGHPHFSLRKGLHVGLEFDWTMASWWKGQYRFGVNQGYPTLGASFLFTLLRLDLVTYGEDVGSYDSSVENRMYMAKFNIDI